MITAPTPTAAHTASVPAASSPTCSELTPARIGPFRVATPDVLALAHSRLTGVTCVAHSRSPAHATYAGQLQRGVMRRRVVVLVVVALLGAPACGSDDGSGEDPRPRQGQKAEKAEPEDPLHRPRVVAGGRPGVAEAARAAYGAAAVDRVVALADARDPDRHLP